MFVETGVVVSFRVGAKVGVGGGNSVADGRLVGEGVSVEVGKLVGGIVSVAVGRLVGKGVSVNGWVGIGSLGGKEDGKGYGVLLGKILDGTNSCWPTVIWLTVSRQFTISIAPMLTP